MAVHQGAGYRRLRAKALKSPGGKKAYAAGRRLARQPATSSTDAPAAILDRSGRKAPTRTMTEVFKQPNRIWTLLERRGAIAINEDGQPAAVMVSLSHFVSLLFGMHPQLSKRQKSRKPARKSR